MESLENRADKIVVRGLKPEDLEPVIALDAKTVGRRRDEYFKLKLQQNLAETGKICGAVTTSGDPAPGVCLFGYCRPSCDTIHGDLGANGCPNADLACYGADIFSETPTFDSDGALFCCRKTIPSGCLFGRPIRFPSTESWRMPVSAGMRSESGSAF